MKISELVENCDSNVLTATEFLCGTEYEIEGIYKVKLPDHDDGPVGVSSFSGTPQWFGDLGFVTDGSLRNDGLEILTRPVSFDKALFEFERVRKCLTFNPKYEQYTARTSTHIHVNVLPWTVERAKEFVLLYAALEPLFFHYVGDRKYNIHCTPLNFTLLPEKYNSSITHLAKNGVWSKYTAFNLLPIYKYGTIEFRHLRGTGDVYEYKFWLTMLRDLWQHVNDGKSSIKLMLSAGKSPKDIAKMVFSYDHSAAIEQLDFTTSFTDVKLALI